MRNRVRRRLRAVARRHAGALVPGWYLVGAEADVASAPFSVVEAQFCRAASAAGALRSPAAEVH